MTQCPSCDSKEILDFDFQEGSIYSCLECKLRWGETESRNNINANINIDNAYINSQNELHNFKQSSVFFSYLKNYFSKSSLNILDIGCGNGAFIKESLTRGHEACGIEMNKKIKKFVDIDIADRICFDFVENFNDPEQKFDIITFWNSFEHLENPFLILSRLKAVLNNNGMVYLRVNNTKDILNYLSIKLAQYSPAIGKPLLKTTFNFPEHFWQFSEAAMTNMLSEHGWVILESRITETPASRIFHDIFRQSLLEIIYAANRLFKAGRTAEYWLRLQI